VFNPVPLIEIVESDTDVCGGKAVGLARLIHNKLPVPEGFVIPVGCFESHIDSLGLDLDGLDLVGIRGAISSSEFPQALVEPILREAKLLGFGGSGGEATRLAVRSSAVDEDANDHSFAGQYLSILNVVDENGLFQAILDCWASWFSDGAAVYRQRRGISGDNLGMAVVVQRLVDSCKSGVMFTVNPHTGSWKEMVIEAVCGQAEGVVSGAVSADRYIFRRPKLRRVSSLNRVSARVRVDEVSVDVVEQRRQLLPSGDGGLQWVGVDRPNERKLSREDATRLARIGLRIERMSGLPQDIEWAQNNRGEFYLLQSRAITSTPPQRPPDEVLWTRRFFGERWSGVASPMGWSITDDLLRWFIEYPITSRRFLDGSEPTRLIRGRPYFNVTVFRHLMFKLPGSPPPRFILEFFPPEEEQRWLRRRAAAPNFLLYGYIFYETFREKRWQRFRWNPISNHKAWDDYASRLEGELSSIGRMTPVASVQASIELVREYIKIHIISLMYANILFQMAESVVPPHLRELLLVCNSDNKTLQVNGDLNKLARLKRSEGIAKYRSSLNDFLELHGHRSSANSWEIFVKRWSEDPGSLERLLNATDLGSVETTSKENSPSQVDAAMRELESSHGFFVGRWVCGLVRLTQRYLQLRENQRYEFDRLLLATKSSLLAVGSDLFGAESELIEWLEWSEVKDAISGKTSNSTLKETAVRRKAEWRDFEKDEEPCTFYVGDEPLETNPGMGSLKGLGISSGRYTGRVCVLSSPEQSDDLRAGDVLVTRSTDPGWTPLFSVAGAVVMEMGSMLSHGAVVAREYGLPAVVNVEGVTKKLSNGEIITVDGSRGVILICSRD